MNNPIIRVLSLGAGVQSTTMSLMAAKGELGPSPDCAIFADTGWEPEKVYAHLSWLTKELPFPVHVVSSGNLREDIINRSNTSGGRFAAVPWFMIGPDQDHGMGRRQCTNEYKLNPIRRKVRELLGDKTPKGGAEIWIGISTDEAMRMKPSRVGYMINRWPLIEKQLNRNDCIKWLERNGYPAAPKSSCIGCPFHSNHQWRELKNNPKEWADAVAVDKAIRNQPGMRGQQFMHAKRVPLDEVDLSTAEDRGQLNLFINECEGMCGV